MKIFVCACEPSADLYVALYLKKLKKHLKNVEIVGIGGEELIKIGARILLNIEKFSIFGFSQAINSLNKSLNLYKKIGGALQREKPDLLLAVAYPGLNLLLLKHCKKLGIKTVYLLPPQIWAWGNFRKYFVKKYADLVLSVFPFETEYYKNLGINTEYCNNPLVNYLKQFSHIKREKSTIGLMPGSRYSQVKRHLPLMIELARELKKSRPGLRFKLILLADQAVPANLPRDIEPTATDRHKNMAQCQFIILSSGTASLEAGLMGIPISSFISLPWSTRLLVDCLSEPGNSIS